MTKEQLLEGCKYAENAFIGAQSHVTLDKKLIKESLDFTGKSILDFGCGMGGMTLWYATQWNCQVTGIDIDPNHIEIAEILRTKHKVKNVQFELRNILEKPLTEKYDYIILNDVAEHIPLWILKTILVQLQQSLSPKGRIFVSYPPWEGPYASHLNHVLTLPWCQFLPKSWLKSLVKNKDRKLVGTKTILQEYEELNHLNHTLLNQIIEEVGLQITYRKSHSKWNNWKPLANKNLRVGPFKYFITKELLLLSNK
ncbi:MAG: class I SAM-dependent methyltransferase [Spirosomataceae bacterium]